MRRVFSLGWARGLSDFHCFIPDYLQVHGAVSLLFLLHTHPHTHHPLFVGEGFVGAVVLYEKSSETSIVPIGEMAVE